MRALPATTVEATIEIRKPSALERIIQRVNAPKAQARGASVSPPPVVIDLRATAVAVREERMTGAVSPVPEET